jgi:hypothetical protein
MQQQYDSESGEEFEELPPSESTNQMQTSWIQWFCSLEGNDVLVEVDKSFVNSPNSIRDLQE